MAGITSHNAIKDLDLFAYAGENHIFNHFGGSFGGFGNPANVNLNSGCDTLNSPNCSGTTGPLATATSGTGTTLGQGQIQDVWQVTGGFYWRLYDGDKGVAAWGIQDAYTVDTTVADKNGLKGEANDNTVLASFRFYPKYGTLIGSKP